MLAKFWCLLFSQAWLSLDADEGMASFFPSAHKLKLSMGTEEDMGFFASSCKNANPAELCIASYTGTLEPCGLHSRQPRVDCHSHAHAVKAHASLGKSTFLLHLGPWAAGRLGFSVTDMGSQCSSDSSEENIVIFAHGSEQVQWGQWL